MLDYFEDLDVFFYSKRIFIFGFFYYVRLFGCVFIEIFYYQTLLYDLIIDQKSEYISICIVINE